MKKNKINIGLITIFLLIALLGHCREAKIRRESKIANDIKFNAVEVNLEDILTPPTGAFIDDLSKYYIEDASKYR